MLPILFANVHSMYMHAWEMEHFGSTEAGIFLQFEQPDAAAYPSADIYAQALIDAAQDAFAAAKATVYGQLGIPVVVDASGQLTEAVAPAVAAVAQAFPTPQFEQPQALAPVPTPAAAQLQAVAPVAPQGGLDMVTPPYPPQSRGAEGKANQEWAKQVYQVDPSLFYDNRPKKATGEYKGTSPDLKHKSSGVGIWLS